MAAGQLTALEQAARSYLSEQLGKRAPARLKFEAEFAESPLEGEGPTALFSFDLKPTPGAAVCDPSVSPRHYVCVGQTVPNYFPAYGLSPDQAYSLHIGTRFMLELQVSKADGAAEPAGAREQMRQFVVGCNPGTTIEQEELSALFLCQEDMFAVYRLQLGGRAVYCLGGACPPGFYELTQHPPQLVLRLHLGNLIREEARVAKE